MDRWVTNIFVWTSLKYFVGSVCTYKAVWLLVDWYFFFPLKKKKTEGRIGAQRGEHFFPKFMWREIQKYNPDWFHTWFIFHPSYSCLV